MALANSDQENVLLPSDEGSPGVPPARRFPTKALLTVGLCVASFLAGAVVTGRPPARAPAMVEHPWGVTRLEEEKWMRDLSQECRDEIDFAKNRDDKKSCDVRGLAWCTNGNGEGGNCCNDYHCDLDDARKLRDDDDVAARRPVCFYSGGEEVGTVQCTLVAESTGKSCKKAEKPKNCVRGLAWCTNKAGEGGNCCSDYDCSLNDIRKLPDDSNVASSPGRPVCWYSGGPETGAVQWALVAESTGKKANSF